MNCFRTIQRYWFRHHVYRKPYASRDRNGDPVYGTQVHLMARVEQDYKKILGPDGNEVAASHVIYTDQPINWYDVVWLPGDDQTDNEQGRVILSVKATPAGTGDFTLYEARL